MSDRDLVLVSLLLGVVKCAALVAVAVVVIRAHRASRKRVPASQTIYLSFKARGLDDEAAREATDVYMMGGKSRSDGWTISE